MSILEQRKKQVYRKGKEHFEMSCDKESLAGSVSQRACVFCGSRVVLYPISDAIHLVHGPIGCASYTWDIRGALSSGPQIHRNSFSTDLREKDVIFGGTDKLRGVIENTFKVLDTDFHVVLTGSTSDIVGDDVGDRGVLLMDSAADRREPDSAA